MLCLGHILAEDGRKMSKHLGNILEPIPLMDRHGADAVRWFMLAGGSPWSARRVGHETLSEVVRKVLLTYWNTASFFTLYAEANGWDRRQPRPAPRAERPLLDRWALAELAAVTDGVTAALEDFDTQTRRPADRRLRRRPVQLVRPPFAPSLLGRRPLGAGHAARGARRPHPADGAVHPVRHRRGVGPRRRPGPGRDAPDSVHLASWPDGRRGRPDDDLVEQVALVRRLVELGRSARTSAKVRTRQPLARAVVAAPGWASLPRDLVAEVADELNVIEMVELSGAVGGELVDVSLKIDFRAVGRRLGKQVQAVAKAVAAADPAALTAAYRAGTATVEVDGAAGPLEEGDLIVTETPREGWTVASGGGPDRRAGPRP